jgi:hypothetical protein
MNLMIPIFDNNEIIINIYPLKFNVFGIFFINFALINLIMNLLISIYELDYNKEMIINIYHLDYNKEILYIIV